MRTPAYAMAVITIGVAAALGVSGCTQTAFDPPASTTPPATAPSDGTPATPGGSASPSPSQPPTDAATTTPAPTASASADHGTVPTTCKATMSAATYAKTFAGTPLNPAGYDLKKELGLITAPAQVNGRGLECLWRDPRADITNLDMVIAPVDPAKAVAALASLETQAGFTCGPLAEGTRCQRITIEDHYGVEVGETYYVRGSTGVYISQANFPTNGLLNEVIARVW